MVVVGLVLLVACANLASFLLAQARDRRKEVAIRLAIGANRSVLVRQFLIESLLLSAVGGVAGVLVSGVALHAVLRADLPLPLPITLDVSLDWRVFSFAIAASAIAGVLFGLLPALQATRATRRRDDQERERRRRAEAPLHDAQRARHRPGVGLAHASHHRRALSAKPPGTREREPRIRRRARRDGVDGDSAGPLRLHKTPTAARQHRASHGEDSRRRHGRRDRQPDVECAEPAGKAHSRPWRDASQGPDRVRRRLRGRGLRAVRRDRAHPRSRARHHRRRRPGRAACRRNQRSDGQPILARHRKPSARRSTRTR